MEKLYIEQLGFVTVKKISDTKSTVDSLKSEIFEISNEIYKLAELGSEEKQSSSLLVEHLKRHGFKVTYPYLGIKTAFRGEWGIGGPTVALLAEYDALPNGHSCGHNLISGWAFGTAVALSRTLKRGRVVVLGTPSEEGIGIYAGSKVTFVEKGALNGADFAVGIHAMDSWSVGWKSLSDILFQAVFKGKASHMAYSPEKGVNALDALVTAYVAINNLRSWIKNDRLAIIEMIIREGGKVTSIVTDRAVLEIELKAVSGEFLRSLQNKVISVLEGVSRAYGTKLEIKEIQPVYEDYNANSIIDEVLQDSLKKIGISAANQDKGNFSPSVSTDEANVSKEVPTGHINLKIGYPGMALHSDDSAKASDPKVAIDNLLAAVTASVYSIEKIINKSELLRKAKREFNGKPG